MKTELKPCPFCGGDASFDHDDNGWNWIHCKSCDATTNARVSAMDDCKPLLAEAWNRRAPAEPVKVLSDAEINAAWHELTGRACLPGSTAYACVRALLDKYSEQPSKCSEVTGYDAADMASQGAQGFRDGYAAALEDAIAQCNALDNNENSERYQAGVLWCIERIKTLKTQQDGATRGYGADPMYLVSSARLTEQLLRPKCAMCNGTQLFDGHCICPRCNGTGLER